MKIFKDLLGTLGVAALIVGLAAAPAYAAFPMPVEAWTSKCTSTQTQNPNLGTGHPDFCVCTSECDKASWNGSIACGNHNETIVTVNGQPACSCPCSDPG